jgi:adenine-specific DNA methylase
MTYKKKLIEVALPLADDQRDASAREKLVIRGKPPSIHLWWARRPLAALGRCCGLLSSTTRQRTQTASRLRGPTGRTRTAVRHPSTARALGGSRTIERDPRGGARRDRIESCEVILPTVLDPFGGERPIPLEALRLGLPDSYR